MKSTLGERGKHPADGSPVSIALEESQTRLIARGLDSSVCMYSISQALTAL